ncbi:MAG: dihydrodipicolinate synthase family protein [Acidobacteria bacterium]|nr:dihydrodipicolinate synthase family protein [Acidobacteriota bacterium]
MRIVAPLPSVSGIIGACLTPFDPNGHINYDALEREIEFIVGDADAISIAAVEAAEYTVLSIQERKELLRRGTEMVDRRIPVILGASSASPRGVIELAEFAATVGADLVQVLIPLRPWGGQPTMGELVDFFTEVASSSPLPILAYHNPVRGADPSVETTVRLSQIDKVQGFKESSRDITKISRLIEEIELSGNARYFTTMQPLLITLLMGGSGATMPPPATRIGAEVVRAFREGDLEQAKYWQRFFSLFPGKWAVYGFPPVMKCAMKHFGIDLGDPAKPYRSVTTQDHAQIGEFFRLIGLLEKGPRPVTVSFSEVVAALERKGPLLP